MRNYILLAVLFWGAFASANAQNVGIGTSSPAAKFHIEGNGTDPVLRVDDQAADTSPFYINNAGNVGIGTTAPGYSLDVQGTGRFTGNLTIGSYTLPATDGTSGQVLSTNGSGTVSWSLATATAWGLTGNSGTNAATNFIGTTDNVALKFRVNNIASGFLDPAGPVALGYQAGIANTNANSVMIGYQAGMANTSGAANTIMGYHAGTSNTTGSSNVFLGYDAGYSSTTSSDNVFAGYQAGRLVTTGTDNVFVGFRAGASNSTANSNTYIGSNAGISSTGSNNFFGGKNAGTSNSSGSGNVFLGMSAGYAGTANTTGSNNTMVGYQAQTSAANLSNATAIGANAVVSASNALVLGSGANVGIGTSAPGYKLEVTGTGKFSSTLTVGAYTLPATDGTASQVLSTNGSGTVSWASLSSLDATTASNGLTLSTNDVQLGGTLTKATTITQGANNMIYDLTSTGNFEVRKSGATFLYASNAGNLGVGVSSPSAYLDVTGSASGTSGILVRSGNANNAIGSTQLELGYNGTTNYRHSIRTRHNNGTASNNAIDFYLWDNSDPAATLGSRVALSLNGGNVGVGTMSPQGLLHVIGSTSLDQSYTSTNGTLNQLSTSGTQVDQTFTAGASGNLYQVQVYITSSLGTTVFQLLQGATVLYSASLSRSTGWSTVTFTSSVAITSGTQYTIRLADGQNWRYDDAGTYTGGQSSLNAAYDHWFRVYLTNGDHLLVSTAGNTGLGTTSPAYKLDVQGTGRFTSNVTIGSYILPTADGTSGQVLSTDGSGTVSWASATATAWGLTGNSGTSTATNFIGTTDNVALMFRVNNVASGSIDPAGNTFFGYSTGLSSTGTNNTFMGWKAGTSNTSGSSNHFIGVGAGQANTTGSLNHFDGFQAGFSNTTGGTNHFEGVSAGFHNTTGSANHFEGTNAGNGNTTGNNNLFIGYRAGESSTVANNNHFVGFQAGFSNTTGSNNLFVGYQAGTAGTANTTGSNNTLVGYQAQTSAANLTNAAAIGAGAVVSASNALVLGSGANVGIGTSAPNYKLEVNSGGASNALIALFTSGASGSYISTGIGRTGSELEFGVASGAGQFANNAAAGDAIIRTNSGTAKLLFTNSANNAVLTVSGGATPAVGIGNVSPGKTLDVTGTGRFTSTLTVGAYTLPATDGTANQVLSTNGSGAVSWASLSALDATTASNGLTLSTNDVQLGGTLTKATTIANAGFDFSITGTGNVGIGTSTVNFPFTVSSTNSPQIGIYNNNSAAGTLAAIRFQTASGWAVQLQTNQNNHYIEIADGAGSPKHSWDATNYYPGNSSAYIASGTGGVDVVVGNGNLGVGTSTPGYKLEVSGTGKFSSTLTVGAYTLPATDGTANQVLKTNGSGAVSWGTITGESTTASNGLTLTGTNVTLGGTLTAATTITQGANSMIYDMTGSGNFEVRSSGATGLFVASYGNVGVKTTNPLWDLHVNGTFDAENSNGAYYVPNWGVASGTVILGVYDGGNSTAAPQTRFMGQGASGNYYDIGEDASGNFVVEGNDIARLTVLNGGNVGIGTTGPNFKLHVVGTAKVSGNLTVGAYTLPNTDGTANQVLKTNGSGTVSWGTLTGESTTASNGLTLTGTNVTLGGTLTAATTIANGGFNLSVTGTGNLGVGQATPVAKLDVAGGNVAVNDNQIRLRQGTDGNHGLRYAGTGLTFAGITPDGPALYGYSAGVLGTTVTAEKAVLYWNSNGNVGIGTTGPNFPLHVNASTASSQSYGYLNSGGSTGTGSGTNNYSIYASARIAASEFNAVSDARIKQVVNRSAGEADLGTVMALRVTDYLHIDTVANGGRVKKGFIAQEVERVFPEAVTRISNFVPDVFQAAQGLRAEGGELEFTLPTGHSLLAGDSLRLLLPTGERLVKVASVSGGAVRVKWTGGAPSSMFVYGRLVHDFRVLDYDRIYTLGISAIQQQQRQIEAMRGEIARMRADLRAELRAELSAEFRAELDRQRAQLETLTRLTGQRSQR